MSLVHCYIKLALRAGLTIAFFRLPAGSGAAGPHLFKDPLVAAGALEQVPPAFATWQESRTGPAFFFNRSKTMAYSETYPTVVMDGKPTVQAKFVMSEEDLENLLDGMTAHAQMGNPRSQAWLRLYNVLHETLEHVRIMSGNITK